MNTTRLSSIDFLRGLVMFVMCIDHARDYTHYHPSDPMDLTQTPLDVFFLRILAHFCAPTFVLLAGVSAYIIGEKKDKKFLSAFLFKRGIALVLLEITLVNWSWSFNPFYKLTYLQIIWAIGIAMMALSGFIHLQKKYILTISLSIFILHPAVNQIQWDNQTMHYIWSFLLQKNVLEIGFGHMVRTTYPVLPIIGIMAGGYYLGSIFFKEQSERKLILLKLGSGMLFLGLLLRFVGYGDPHYLQIHSNTPLFLELFNVTKYPISLHFALIFIGGSLLLLSFLQGKKYSANNPIIILGQTPMFFYLLHIYLLHGGVLIYMAINEQKIDLTNHLGGIPPSFGITMTQMYALVLVVIGILIPLCKWYRKIKSSKRYPILQYL